MSDGGGNRGLVMAVVILAIALVVVFFLWQRDQESKDMKIDIDAGESSLLEEGPPGFHPVGDRAPVRLAPSRGGAPGTV